MPLKPRKPSPQIFALCSLFTLTTFLLSLSSFNAASAQTQGSTTAASDDPKADEKITALIEGENALAAHAIFNSRIEYASEKFIGAPYLTKGPLGEGPTGKYDQDPLYRTDGFDCTTFVETMISIARAQSFSEFQIQQNLIRYDQGTVDFTHRNHFVEVDWSPNNIQAGLFSDITNSITTSAQRGIAVRTISKKDWYAHLPISKLHLLNTTGVDLNALLDSLHSEGNQMPDVVSQLPYVK